MSDTLEEPPEEYEGMDWPEVAIAEQEAVENSKQRTLLQNSSLHLWCEQLAQILNEAGYEQKVSMGTADAPWSKDTVKILFQKVVTAQFNKKHTSDLTTKELSEAAETFNRYLSEKGISHPFPSEEELINRSYE